MKQTVSNRHETGNRDGLPELETLMQKAGAVAEFLKTLAHETRLMLLCLLAERERSVTELENLLSLRQPTVSQQLARLRLEGLVATRRDGKAIYYRLNGSDTRAIISAIHGIFCKPRDGAEGALGSPSHRNGKNGSNA